MKPLFISIAVMSLNLAAARAEIIGFGDFSEFTINQEDLGAAPSVFPGGIELTNPGANERRSIFHNVPQQIARFKATFTYRPANARRSNGIGYGATFTLQNSPSGPGAVGLAATGFGYAGIDPSVAITLELRSSGDSRSGLFFNGDLGGGSVPTDPLEFFNTNPVDVTIAYNGSLLSTSFADSITGDTFSRDYIVDIPDLLGEDTAYVGFTASTGAAGFSANANQRFSDFHYIPEPSTTALTLICLVGLLCSRLVTPCGARNVLWRRQVPLG